MKNIIALLFIFVNVNSQVLNVESLRFDTDSLNGMYGKFITSGKQRQDKQYELGLNAQAHLAYKYNNHLFFVIGNFKYTKNNSTINENGKLIHLRYNYKITSKLNGELFYQLLHDQFLNIKSRELYGSGFRYLLSKNKIKTFIGTGIMYEEQIPIPEISYPISKGLLSNNYISFKFNIKKSSIMSVMYYQWFLNNISDFKINYNINYEIPIRKHLMFDIGYNCLYDSTPISDFNHHLNKYVYYLNFGIQLDFSPASDIEDDNE